MDVPTHVLQLSTEHALPVVNVIPAMVSVRTQTMLHIAEPVCIELPVLRILPVYHAFAEPSSLRQQREYCPNVLRGPPCATFHTNFAYMPNRQGTRIVRPVVIPGFPPHTPSAIGVWYHGD